METLSVTPHAIKVELERRGILVDVDFIGRRSVLTFTVDGHVRRIIACIPVFQAGYASMLCANKVATEWLVRHLSSVRMPESVEYTTYETACDFLRKHRLIVVKPTDGSHGNGVTVGITNEVQLKKAIESALSESRVRHALIQEHVVGEDVRIFVLNGKARAAVYRLPAGVSGDGKGTIRELIERENATNDNRGAVPYTKSLNQICIAASERYLGDRLDTEIPAKDAKTQVVGTANVGTGGCAIECFDELPRDMIMAAEEISLLSGAFAAGVDMIYDQTSGQYRLIELNAAPSFGLHMMPSSGKSIDIACMYVDELLAKYAAMEAK